MRKGFNFYRSYYDVFKELSTNADKVAFIEALFDRQFTGIEPTQLKGMPKFAYISQKHSIDTQVKGYEDKTKTKLTDYQAYNPPTVGGTKGGTLPPPPQGKGEVQEKEEEKEEEQVQLQGCEILINYSFEEFWFAYDKKVGNKTKLEKKWNSFSDDTRTKILFHLEEYKVSQPDKKYRKNPEAYFNNESWNDEIITNNNNNGQQSKNDLIRDVLGEYGIK